MSDSERLRGQLAVWRDSLLNLTRRNRLLYFKHTKISTLEIRYPAWRDIVISLGSRSPFQFFQPPALVVGEDGKEAPVPRDEWPDPGPGEMVTQKLQPDELQRALGNLSRRATQEFMDKGLRILYIGAPLLKWHDPDTDEDALSPVLLLPIELNRSSPRAPLELRASAGDIVLNPTLLLKLESDFGIQLPMDPIDDPEAALQAVEVVRAAVAREGWTLEDRAVLAPFTFHKEAMYRDLLENEEIILSDPFINALLGGAGAEYAFEPVGDEALDEAAPPESTIAILDADSTQRRCIAAAADGKTFVMDGPPGTGKSQTIANILATAMADGKSALFVSEKAAALDVVQKRLSEAGLAHFVLELHSHKATRKEVAQRLADALNLALPANGRLDQPAVARFRNARVALSQYAAAMNEERPPLGRTLNWAIGRLGLSSHLGRTVGTDIPIESLSAAVFAVIAEESAALGRTWDRVRDPQFRWHGCLLRHGRKTELNVEREVAELSEALSLLRQEVERLAKDWRMGAPSAVGTGAMFTEVIDLLGRRPAVVDPDWIAAGTVDKRLDANQTLAEKARAHLEIHLSVEGSYGIGSAGVNDRYQDISAVESEFAACSEVLQVPAELTVHELEARGRAAFSAAQHLADLVASADDLIEAFGAPEPLTLGQLEAMARGGSKCDSASRPPSEWIDPLYLPAVRRAGEDLISVVVAERSLRLSLGGTFDPGIHDADVVAIVTGYRETRRGMGRFSARHHHYRRTLAEHAIRGTIGSRERASLDDLLECATLRQDRTRREKTSAPILGPYYDGLATDVDRLVEALAIAAAAVAVIERGIEPSLVVALLSEQSEPAVALGELARRTALSIDGWHSEIDEGALAPGENFGAAPIGTLIGVLGRLTDACDSAAELLSEAATVSREVATFAQAGTFHRRLASLADAESKFAEAADHLSDLLGAGFAGLESDWSGIEAGLQWVTELLGALTFRPDPASAEALVRVGSESSVADLWERWTAAVDSFAAEFDQPHEILMREQLDGTFDSVSAYLRDVDASIAEVDVWRTHTQRLERIGELGLGSIAASADARKIDGDDLPPFIERSVLSSWVDWHLDEDPRLRPITAPDRDELVKEFQGLDRRLKRDSVARIVSVINLARPSTAIGQPGIIKREGAKKRRHKPIRLLLEEAGETAQAVAPVFMMSPLAVSQFIPPSMRFDLVVFDEASQVRPEDAVNCLYRGDQVIIAGDQQQLPPTSFFQRLMDDGDDGWDEDEDELEVFESILDISKAAGLPSLPLRWHYRSRHEHLIAYSNHAFYAGDLFTFPGAVDEHPSYGVELFPVNGVYRRGTSRDNPEEAAAVAERVIYHATHHPHLTLGVVAFSEAQASRIEGEIDRRREQSRVLDRFLANTNRLDGFFVKNLESVQGDERDIIVFSVGYGRDEVGKLTMNFGPLNLPGGERRLNVAITRARQRVEVVSSISSDDITSTKPGVLHLKRYLDFASRGPAALAYSLTDSSGDVESPLEESVFSAVSAAGFDASPQVGVAGYRVDIGVRHPDHPGRFVLAIECDGRAYHSSKAARDRDRLRQEVLERLGWTVHRVWGPAWYRDRDNQESLLRDRIREAILASDAAGSGSPVPDFVPTVDTAPAEFISIEANDNLPWVSPYLVSGVTVTPTRELHESGPQVRSAILEICAVEAPIAFDLLVERVRTAWGMRRAGSRARDAVRSVVGELSEGGRLALDERDVVWIGKTGDMRAIRVPGPDPRTHRSAEQVPAEEIAGAMREFLSEARSIGEDDLTAAVSRLFGWQRRGVTVQAALDAAIDLLLAWGSVKREGTLLRSPNSSNGVSAEQLVEMQPALEHTVPQDALAAGHDMEGLAAVALLAADLVAWDTVSDELLADLESVFHDLSGQHDIAQKHDCIFMDRSPTAGLRIAQALEGACLYLLGSSPYPPRPFRIEAEHSAASKAGSIHDPCVWEWWRSQGRPYFGPP